MENTPCLLKYASSIFSYVAYAGLESDAQLKFYYVTNRLKRTEN